MERRGKERVGNFEMNIRVGDGKPSAFPMKLLNDEAIVRQTEEAAISAILDGYTVLVYNFLRTGATLTPQDSCEFHGFDLEKAFNNHLEQRSLAKVATGQTIPDFSRIKQFTRLTMLVANGGQIHQMINLSAKTGDKTTKILNTYDVIAMRPAHTQDIYE